MSLNWILVVCLSARFALSIEQEPEVPLPVPTDAPKVYKWAARDATTNRFCVILEMTSQFQVKLNQTVNGKVREEGDDWDLNADALDSLSGLEPSFAGNCVQNKQKELKIEVSFRKGLSRLEIYFKASKTSYSVSIFNLAYAVDDQGPNNYNASSSLKGSFFETPFNKSYSCKSKQPLVFNGDDDVTLIISDLKFEAFVSKEKADFSPGITCKEDSKLDNVLPFIIGLSLSVIFVSILVVFTIIRRRSSLNKGF